MDKLIVTGLGKHLDGEYECDLLDLALQANSGLLTNRELHRIKVMSGVRRGEFVDALSAYDNDLLVAFAAVILARKGKAVNEDALWDAPADAVTYDIGEREPDPPAEPAATPETDSPSTSGGGSPSLTSENQANGQSPTGHPVSLTSVTSGQAT